MSSPTLSLDDLSLILAKAQGTTSAEQGYELLRSQLFSGLVKNDSTTQQQLAHAFSLQADELLQRYIDNAPSKSIEAFENLTDAFAKLLDLATFLVIHGENVADFSVPMTILRDFMDALPVDKCSALWAILEARADSFVTVLTLASQAGKFVKQKNVLLRTAIGLLRRLSKTTNPIFSGRILAFLAYVFPLDDPSGLNARGKENVDNTTEIDSEPEEMEAGEEESMMDIVDDDGAKHELTTTTTSGEVVDEQTPPVNWKFYRTFWGLQDFFQTPSKAYQSADQWSKLMGDIDTVVSTFTTHPLSAEDAKAAKEAQLDILRTAQEDTTKEFTYFAKYLSRSKLLGLQMNDPIFRRYILMQMLTLFQSLRVLSDEARESQVQENVMSDAQQKDIKTRTSTVKSALSSMLPSGRAFASTAFNILRRENNWIQWKKEGCKPYARTPTSTQKEFAKPSRKKRIAGEALETLPAFVFNADHPWDIQSAEHHDVLSYLKSRKEQTSIKTLLEPVREQMDPEAGIEDQYKYCNKDVFIWKTLRRLGRENARQYYALGQNEVARPDCVEEIVRQLQREGQMDGPIFEKKAEVTAEETMESDGEDSSQAEEGEVRDDGDDDGDDEVEECEEGEIVEDEPIIDDEEKSNDRSTTPKSARRTAESRDETKKKSSKRSSRTKGEQLENQRGEQERRISDDGGRRKKKQRREK